MKFKADIDIMPLEALLDPQGKAVSKSMGNLGLDVISNVRVGKHISLYVEADSESTATEKVNEACDKLLCNKIMENFSFKIKEITQ